MKERRKGRSRWPPLATSPCTSHVARWKRRITRGDMDKQWRKRGILVDALSPIACALSTDEDWVSFIAERGGQRCAGRAEIFEKSELWRDLNCRSVGRRQAELQKGKLGSSAAWRSSRRTRGGQQADEAKRKQTRRLFLSPSGRRNLDVSGEEADAWLGASREPPWTWSPCAYMHAPLC